MLMELKVEVPFVPFIEIASDGTKDCPRIVPLNVTLPLPPHRIKTHKNKPASARRIFN